MSLWKKNNGDLDKIAGNVKIDENIPKIVAWAYVQFSHGSTITGSISAGYNIKNIIRESTVTGLGERYYWKVNFNSPIIDKNYAAVVCVDMDGTQGREMTGIYDHLTTSFKFDCYYDNTATEGLLVEANIIVVR